MGRSDFPTFSNSNSDSSRIWDFTPLRNKKKKKKNLEFEEKEKMG